jgi:thiamine-monophosphate kinase
MEFDLIERIRQRVVARDDVVLGIGDDAAILALPAGRQLVVATDTLNAGVHFPPGTAAADIGWKALAVNLSDLAAMGADPAWCTLSLSLPEASPEWLDGFLDGFLELAAVHRVALVGGDTTRGPLSVCVTVHGLVEPGRVLRRDRARVGDDIWVSGTLGDAAGALALLQRAAEPVVAPACEAGPVLAAEPAGDAPGALAVLRPRLDRPTPRVELGRRLAGVAHAAVDVSDGLLADLGHVCRASGVGAEIDVDALPGSVALHDAFDAPRRRSMQAAGGDDYELCFTAAPDRRDGIEALAGAADVPLARVGRITGGAGVVSRDRSGAPWTPERAGYAHFAEPGAVSLR